MFLGSPSVTGATVLLNTPGVSRLLHSITVTCTIRLNSVADQCVVMAMTDGGVTKTGTYVHMY